jgi:hypothetical protein
LNFKATLLLIDTDAIHAADRHFMLLWFELMFESPAIVDGVPLSYEEVAKLSTKDLVDNSVGVRVSSFYDRYMAFKVSVFIADYLKLIFRHLN